MTKAKRWMAWLVAGLMALLPAASLAAVDTDAWLDAFEAVWAQADAGDAVDWKLMHEETDGELLLAAEEEGLYVSVSEAMDDIEYFAKVEMADMTDVEGLDASERMGNILMAAVVAHTPDADETVLDEILAGLQATMDEAFSSEDGQATLTDVQGWYIKVMVDDTSETLSIYMSAAA